jgi:hypothetical protein
MGKSTVCYSVPTNTRFLCSERHSLRSFQCALHTGWWIQFGFVLGDIFGWAQVLHDLSGMSVLARRNLHLLLSWNDNLGNRNVFDTILSCTLLFLAWNLSWLLIKIKVARNLWTEQVAIDVWVIAFGQIDDTIFVLVYLMAFFERLNSMSFQGLFVEMGELFSLFIGLTRNQLELFWPDVLGFGKAEYLLSSDVDDHGSYLITRVSLIFEAGALFDHFV